MKNRDDVIYIDELVKELGERLGKQLKYKVRVLDAPITPAQVTLIAVQDDGSEMGLFALNAYEFVEVISGLLKMWSANFN